MIFSNLFSVILSGSVKAQSIDCGKVRYTDVKKIWVAIFVDLKKGMTNTF